MKGIFVVGPSGSGKSTLCSALAGLYSQLFGSRSSLIINLDCANPNSKAEIDINSLIELEDVMEEYQIGPNASLLYSIDFLWENIEWLNQQIDKRIQTQNPSHKLVADNQQLKAKLGTTHTDIDNIFLIFDLPGQAELYLSHDSLKKIIHSTIKRYSLAPCVLELFDCTYLYQISDFVSMCMMCLSTMVNLELPHLSLLNKIDLMKGRRPALGLLNDYFSLMSLKEIVKDLNDDPNNKIIHSIATVIDQYGQVSFLPCSVQKPDLLLYLIYQLEKVFGTLQFNLMISSKFANATKQWQSDFAGERLISQLEGELFEEEEGIDVQELLRQMKAK